MHVETNQTSLIEVFQTFKDDLDLFCTEDPVESARKSCRPRYHMSCFSDLIWYSVSWPQTCDTKYLDHKYLEYMNSNLLSLTNCWQECSNLVLYNRWVTVLYTTIVTALSFNFQKTIPQLFWVFAQVSRYEYLKQFKKPTWSLCN
jgi:hypothetical protein